MRKNRTLAAGLLLCLAVTVSLCLAWQSSSGKGSQPASSCSIVISEICPKNETVLADNDGRYRDYIELYNPGDDVELTGFRLSDGKTESQPFGSLWLRSGEYRVFFLGTDLTGFTLSASGGDALQLLDAGGAVVAQVQTVTVGEDQAMLRIGGDYLVSDRPSPGFSNDETGVKAFREGTVCQDPALRISELLIRNISALPDEAGSYGDVLELYNASARPISLGAYFLSDDAANRFHFRLPEQTLAPGQYLTVFCDGGNYIAGDGTIHANFAVSLGETLYLTDSLGRHVTVTAEDPGRNCSQVWTESGFLHAPASPGYANDEAGQLAFAASRVNEESLLVVSEVLLSSARTPYQGAFPDVVELVNRSDQAVSTAGWYLSDGGDPYAYGLEEVLLAPGERLVVVCGEETTGFRLSKGESLILTGPDYTHAPVVVCRSSLGQSLSLLPEGDAGYSMSQPTPGFPNDGQGLAQYLAACLPVGLRISEVMTANASYLKGSYGTVCDWVELYNSSAEPVYLGDYCFSDDPDWLRKHPLPDRTLAPGEYCVFLLSEEPMNLRKGYDVLPFALSSGGESLYLSKNAVVTDHVWIPELSRDTSYGRVPGDAGFSLLAKATPGEANGEAAQILAVPTAITPQGSYDGVEYLDVILEGEGDIYYTTDCTFPGQKAVLYTDPIRITQTTVIRAVCRAPGKTDSPVLDLTYLVNENDSLSAVCLVAAPEDLWSGSTGIYAYGAGASDTFPYKGANFWQDWERPCTVSLFEADGSCGFSVGAGVKIFGGFSRGYEKKSLALFFRGCYGCSRLEYPLFGDKGLDTYEAFVLRAGGQDVFTARIRDELVTSLVDDYTQVAVQDYRPVVVYLNGRYFGVYYIREKINEQYVAGNFNAAPEDCQLCEYNGYSSQDYVNLINYVHSHNLALPENYEYVCSQVDIEAYMDYLIAQMCVGNDDNTNIKYCKTTEGKWNWILFDTDHGYTLPGFDAVSDHLNPEGTGTNDNISTALINGLLGNPEFKSRFLRRFAWQLNTIWTEENLSERIDLLTKLIDQDMRKDCLRWNKDYDQWLRYVERLRTQALERNSFTISCIQSYFHLTDDQMAEYGFYSNT